MTAFGSMTPRQITAWLHDRIAEQSPQHAEMVAAYREKRKLPDDQLPATAGQAQDGETP